MSEPIDISRDFQPLYHPISALVVYESKGPNTDAYVEHFDLDRNGNPVNAHPLTVREAKALARALNTEKKKGEAFLKPKGILPTKILQINPAENGSVLWYTKAQQRQLFFIESLEIANGKANMPPMLWFADKQRLSVFALKSDRRPSETTTLYHAPFFNVYENGNVCMGTVDVNIKNSISVEAFIESWENYFFNSYFTHLLNEHNPIKGNCISVWKDLIGTSKAFPKEILKKSHRKLKNFLF